MKIACSVHGKAAMIVGYAPGKKNKPLAIVITEGQLKSVRLRDVDLGELAKELQGEANSIVSFKKKNKG